MNTVTEREPITSCAPRPDAPAPCGADPAGTAQRYRSVARRVAVVVAMIASATVVIGGSASWTVVRLAIVGLAGWGLLALDGRRPVVAAAAGAVTTAVGVGFLPYLVDEGPGWNGLAAIALIVAGLSLVVLGTTDLVRRRRWWWQVLAGVLAVAALGVTVSVVAPSVLATNVPRPQLGETPAERGLDADSATLTTSDGVDLAAWYVPSGNGAAVVLRHGAGSTRSDVLDEAVVLARHGYGVLMTDAGGHGESCGRAMDFGWNGDVEVAAAIEFLESEMGIERIGLVGMSMGGEEVLGAAGAQPQVAAVVAEGATARRAADKAWLSDVYGVRGALQEQLERVQDGLTDLLTEADPPTVLRDAVRRSDAAVLLITAGAVPDEAHAAARIASGAPDRVEIWSVPGADHIDGLATDPDGWEQRVIGILDANL